jgi:hypothetical protein
LLPCDASASGVSAANKKFMAVVARRQQPLRDSRFRMPIEIQGVAVIGG